MEMKKVYMVQPNYLYGNSAHFPYASGALIAYAWKNQLINNHYSMEKIFFLRDNIDESISEMENPFLVGFSTYVWNFEYNKSFAKKLKDKFPNCIIVFGGHHVAPGSELMEQSDYIDVLVHGEGEEVFEQLLLSFLADSNCSSIPNISYRLNGSVINTKYRPINGHDYPSPYEEGCFDSLIKENENLDFIAMLETNRGCPYGCAYCDWGSLSSNIRKFPMKRIRKDIDWFREHRIDGVGGADSNFGIFERDSDIIDWLVDSKVESGYPNKFQVSYAKNSTLRIFEMTKKLNEHNMSKGVTLSFQTMSQTVADNVSRTNIDIDFFTDLMRLYNEANIATYTELILGLPGETFESFVSGVNELLKAGQHYSMKFHNCEWLPCSAMGKEEYVKKFKIELSVIPLNQPHMKPPKVDEIQEYSKIVTKTFSMDNNAWIEMNMFSFIVQCFHHMGLLQFFAIYLFYEQGIEYDDFYLRLLDFVNDNPDTVCGGVFASIRQKLQAVIKGTGSLVCYNEKFGDVAWPFEEYSFLEIICQNEVFYDEIKVFLTSFDMPKDIFRDLLLYQKNMIKIPNKAKTTFELSFNFHKFFANIFVGKENKLLRRKSIITIVDDMNTKNWEDYARYVVWYGRRDSRNFYTDSVIVKDDHNE